MKKKILLGSILLALAWTAPVPTLAEVGISIGISLPPPIVFQAPPEVIVVPDAYGVYVVPDVEVDLFFWNGWWWRPWEGRWYRSRYYDRGWAYYRQVPRFYYDVDPGWRGYYRGHDWHGHRWDYERIPNRRLQQNWRGWNNNRYWERQRSWGVQSYRARPPQERRDLRRQREEQYRQRPEVQRHERERMQQQRQQPQRPPQGRVERPPQDRGPQGRAERPPQDRRPPARMEAPPQHRGDQPPGDSRRQQPQGKPGRGEGERRGEPEDRR